MVDGPQLPLSAATKADKRPKSRVSPSGGKRVRVPQYLGRDSLPLRERVETYERSELVAAERGRMSPYSTATAQSSIVIVPPELSSI